MPRRLQLSWWLVTLVSLLPASTLAAWTLAPNVIVACQTSPRGGGSGLLRMPASGEPCRPGETTISWPASQSVVPTVPPRAVVRDAANAVVGPVIGMDQITKAIVPLTLEGQTVALVFTGHHVQGTLPFSSLFWSEPACRGVVMTLAPNPGLHLLAPAYVTNPLAGSDFLILVPDPGQPVSQQPYQSMGFGASCYNVSATLNVGVLAVPFTLPFAAPFTVSIE
jgi:hypothetical protein